MEVFCLHNIRLDYGINEQNPSAHSSPDDFRECGQRIFMNFNITLLPGDGIGPEVVTEGVRVLDVISSKYNHAFQYKERLMGGCSIDKYGSSLTDETLAVCQSADAILFGAVGGPKWDDPSAKDRPERGLLRLRKGLGVFANMRPVKVMAASAQWIPSNTSTSKSSALLSLHSLSQKEEERK